MYLRETFRKVNLLLWKNFTLRKRQKLKTGCEILIPILLSLLICFVRSAIMPEIQPPALYRPFKSILPPVLYSKLFVWSPWNQVLQQVIRNMLDSLSTNAGSIIEERAFEDSQTLEKYLKNEMNMNRTLAGMQFDDSLKNVTSLPPVLHITLRFPGELRFFQRGNIENLSDVETTLSEHAFTWRTNRLFSDVQTRGPRSRQLAEGGYPSYYNEGFLLLQQEFFFALMGYYEKVAKRQTTRKPHIFMHRFPYPEWHEDKILVYYAILFALFTMFAFLMSFLATILDVCHEKEKQLKEVMKIMGLPSWMHWLGWFLKAFIVLLISVSFVAVIFKVRWYSRKDVAIFTHSNGVVLAFFLLVYACALTASAFAITTLFSRAIIAVFVGILFWILSFAILGTIIRIDLSGNISYFLLRSLIPNGALLYGFQIFILYEIISEGMQWNNIWRPPSPNERLALGHLILVLIFDTVIYMLITLYMEQVIPSEYGVPQPWYFPFTKSFWCGFMPIADHQIDERSFENEFYEKDSTDQVPGITILHLCKTYSKDTAAVENLTMNLFQNQITVLLGCNGAGKSTTISMLCGMIRPSSGTAIVNGYDIRKNIKGVRQRLGYCPQHDILFDDMTVAEHLRFYCVLRGYPQQKVEAETLMYLRQLNLTVQKHELTKKLSGGMKRKLSLCLALCGESRVVVCDEPSSGMDPAARRDLWDLLKQQKKNRTILLTTQSMDEADIVGDRIAILDHGRLQCYGSNFFLKKLYKIGYHLVIEVSPECNVRKLTTLLQGHIPSIQLDSDIGAELVYLLPDDQSALFGEMLHDLESSAKKLYILSFGISLAKMEAVFMKAVSQQAVTDERSQSFSLSDHDVTTDAEKLEGCNLYLNHVKAMLLKKVKVYGRSWSMMLFVVAILFIYLIRPYLQWLHYDYRLKDLPRLKIELDAYANPITVLTDQGNNTYYKQYIGMLTKNNNKLVQWRKKDFSKNMLKQTKRREILVKQHYIIGASFFNNNSVTAWFNNEPLHSAPLALQLVINSILKNRVSENHYIQFYNYPLPFTTITREKFHFEDQSKGLDVATSVTLTLSFITPLFIIFYVKERISRIKRIHFVSGIEIATYWMVSFLFDFVIYCGISACVILIILSLQVYKTFDELIRLVGLMIGFGAAAVPLNYLATYLFNTPMQGYISLATIHAISALLTSAVVNISKSYSKSVAKTMHLIFLMLPSYGLITGIKDLNTLRLIKQSCDKLFDNCIYFQVKSISGRTTMRHCRKQVCEYDSKCCLIQRFYQWERPGIGKQTALFPLEGIGLAIILFLIEYRLLTRFVGRTQESTGFRPDNKEDGDVQQERKKVYEISPSQRKRYAVIMKNLTKQYKRGTNAVDKLTVSIQNYECFGLLGYNGAGKTTTFKMLIGDTTISSGEIWINGVRVKSRLVQTYQDVGYCPQEDALLDNLTCLETLTIFCRFRGIRKADSKRIAKSLATSLGFREHLDEYVKNLSGGNRRKLTTAVALTGDPSVLYLDEPTTGLDPASKRCVWNLLRKVRDSGKCIILTSHSMEECEALCTRLAIMVNGRFMCLGSIQHLKSKFATGYTLTIKVLRTKDLGDDLQKINSFVMKNFPSALLREQHENLITYSIRDASVPCSKMFGTMENSKSMLNVEDYSLGQSTLEQVFLSFRSYQREPYPT